MQTSFARFSTAAFIFIALMAMPTATCAQSFASAPGSHHAQNQPCVLLRNDGVLHGTATQLGTIVRIQRDDSSVIELDRREVLCWGDSMLSLYQFKKDHRSETNFARLVADARWCLKHNLIAQAADDIRAARSLNGADTTANHLAQRIARRITEPLVAEKTDRTPSAVRTVSHESIVPTPESQGDVSGADNEDLRNISIDQLDPGTLQLFVKHVQPVLLNRCVRCHDNRSDSNFQLVAPVSGTRASSRIAKENLAAAMRFVKTDDPLRSDLLLRMTDGHAGEKFKTTQRLGRSIIGVQRWLSIARSVKPLATDNARLQIASQEDISIEPLDPTATMIQAPEAPSRDADQQAGKSADSKEKRIARLPPVKNPFDPDLFNRRFHRD